MRDVLYTNRVDGIPENFNPKLMYLLKEEVRDEPSTIYHPNEYTVLIYILSGSCTYQINHMSYKAEKGQVVLLNPGSSHKKILGPGDRVLEFNMGFFSNTQIQGLPKNFLIREDDCPVITLKKYGTEFYKCCKRIIQENEKNEFGRKMMLKGLAMELIAILLTELYPNEVSREKSESHSNRRDKLSNADKQEIVSIIIKYMNENYQKDISLEQIAQNMHLSPIYVSKLFKEVTGESPINYLIQVRLSRARTMLVCTKMQIKAIAESVGYDNVFYFSKLFKKYYGYSPSNHKEG